MKDWPALARGITEQVLLPSANAVDTEGKIPAGHFETLAANGFYGISALPGPGATDLELDVLTEVLEILYSGCLATTFTWLQHLGVVYNVASTSNTALREGYRDKLMAGTIKGSVSGAARAQPPMMHARRTEDGYVLDGLAPFVTGWGMVDVVLVVAHDQTEDVIVKLLLDAEQIDQASVQLLPLIAARASNTVKIRFDGFPVAADRVCGVSTPEEFVAPEGRNSRLSASMSMGITRRCLAQLEERGVDASELAMQRSRIREHLDAAFNDRFDRHAARAESSELAIRAAATLVAATGSSASVSGNTAERLMREATMAMLTASRPQIREAIVARLQRPSPV